MTEPRQEQPVIETINLEKARQLLETVDEMRMRSIRRRMVEQYARDMLSGRWHVHTAALGVNELGRLVDGNHRMRAFVMAAEEGCPPHLADPDLEIEFLVVRNIKADVAVEDTIDTGKSRQYRDVLSIRGHTDPTLTASVARRMMAWDTGYYYSPAASSAVSFSEMDTYLEKHEDEVAAATTFGRAHYFEARLAPSTLAVAHVILHRLDGEAADDFLNRLVYIDNVSKDSPLGLLIRRYINLDRDEGKSRNSSVNQAKRLALLFVAWNHFREGTSPKRLSLPKGTLSNKNFPVPG